MNKSDICWCGHTRLDHDIDREMCCDEHSDVEYPICLACMESDNDYDWDHEFQQDNLRFLEIQSLKKDKKNTLKN